MIPPDSRSYLCDVDIEDESDLERWENVRDVDDRDLDEDGQSMTVEEISRYDGNYMDFRRLVRAKCRQVGIERVQGVVSGEHDRLDASLMAWAGDFRMLRATAETLASEGGPARGVDNMGYGECLGNWGLLRALSRNVTSGPCPPEPLKPVSIPKGDGDTRELHIPTVLERIVQRSMLTVLDPLLDPMMVPTVHGYRAGRSPHTALAHAMHIAETEDRRYWAKMDIRNAFHSVPLGRLRMTVENYIPEGPMLDQLRLFIHRGRARPPGLPWGCGIPLGCPLSPLFLNLFLHHHVDAPWHGEHDTPILRYADDFLALCRDESEAREAKSGISRLLKSAGLELNDSKTVLTDITSRPAGYMGFGVTWLHGACSARVTMDALRELEAKIHWYRRKGIAKISECMDAWLRYVAPGTASLTRRERAELVDHLERITGDTWDGHRVNPRNSLFNRVARSGQRWRHIRNDVLPELLGVTLPDGSHRP